MNTIVSYLIQLVVTLAVISLIVGYLRPHLRKVLVDLCGTEDRAQFWTVFSNILLLGMPMILALNYRPEANTAENLFFEVAGKLSGNLGGLLFATICVGVAVSFFALVAPKTQKVEAK
jgi:type IV secretory pathway VirB6-like protein